MRLNFIDVMSNRLIGVGFNTCHTEFVFLKLHYLIIDKNCFRIASCMLRVINSWKSLLMLLAQHTILTTRHIEELFSEGNI